MASLAHNETTEEMAAKKPSESRIATVITSLMQLYGLSQQELAAKWGVSPSAVSKILAGDRQDVSMAVAQRLIDAFGLDPRALFDVSEDNGKS